jgi:hypothetical protein
MPLEVVRQQCKICRFPLASRIGDRDRAKRLRACTGFWRIRLTSTYLIPFERGQVAVATCPLTDAPWTGKIRDGAGQRVWAKELALVEQDKGTHCVKSKLETTRADCS